MKILIIGFQRSGTTLLRRIMAMHPEVRKILHENFLLTRCRTKKQIKRFLNAGKINMKTDTWGDKTPYYPNIRRIPVEKYCATWNEHFGEESRIVHVVRHPYDIAFSVHHKYPKQKFGRALNVYRNGVRKAVKATLEMPTVITFKYEELVGNPDEMVPKIYKFCGLNSDVDFRAMMKKWTNKKYQTFDESRIFAYKGKKIPNGDHGLDDIVKDLNDWLGEPNYEL